MSNPNANLKHLQKHHEYYIKGGDLHIVVEHTRFRIHSYFFERESQRFKEIIAAPASIDHARFPDADGPVILLKDVTAPDFSRFLWVFYNRNYSVYKATLPEWTAILKIACEYQFPEVKHLAMRELQQIEIPIAQRIFLYQSYDAEPMYLVPLYVKLCMRDEGPTDEETEKMGMKTSLIIFRARERLRFRPLGAGKDGPTLEGVDENDITRTICSLLGFDFNGHFQHPDNSTQANAGLPAVGKHMFTGIGS
ncbi:hypothetical protein B0H34DRAFT_381923 [Crassisporium funariophilum]|nr:hypothetical protein B0H34DRAFT_381923 [Crassisporium funariophilum]